YSLILRLQRRATAISQTTIAPYLDMSARTCVTALMQKPPLYFEGVGDPIKGGTRMFEELYEI
ncbi:MAG: hypothetical protein GWO23_09230, partial [Gammaproteobacteria bacterium]|nr:hypothetical protein [Gammaproteobacteria bacterium]